MTYTRLGPERGYPLQLMTLTLAGRKKRQGTFVMTVVRTVFT